MTRTATAPHRPPLASYAEVHATAGEEILYQAKTHWWVFAPGFLIMAMSAIPFAAAAQVADSEAGSSIQLGGFALLAGSVLVSLRATLQFLTTDVAVSNQRIQVKKGFIARDTLELKLSKVESLSVSQSLLGRIAGFGTIVVRGTGGGNMKLPLIARAMQLRQATYAALENLEP